MSPTPDALLAGPRGRRLCLELARLSDAELAQMIFAAVYSGPRTASLVWGEPAVDPPTTSELSRALRAIDPVFSRDAVSDALRAGVDSAMYWQQPDEEDELAAEPDVRAALGGIAEAVASDPEVAWWRDGPDLAAQYEVTFDDIPDPFVPAATALSEWRSALDEEIHRAVVERPADPTAPISGAWWSTPPRRLRRTTRALSGGAPVGLELVEDGLGWTRAHSSRLRVPTAPRILTIDGPDAWEQLCRDGIDVTPARQHDWYRTTGRIGRWILPDWTYVARDFDAVHLSVAGYLSTAGRAITVGPAASVLAGWSPDETVWLRDVELVGPRQSWTRDSPSDPCHPARSA